MSDATGFTPDEQPAGFQPDEVPAEGDNLGVYPMPSKAEHLATLAEIQANPVSLTAYRASRGPAPEQATKALALAKARGLSPQFAADNADVLTQAQDQAEYESLLGVGPLAAYAGQSAVHASAVKDDVGVMQALEQGLADVGYQVYATAQMSFPTKFGEEVLQNEEQLAGQFDQRHSGIAADLARSAPQIGAFFLAGKLGQLVGGKPGELGAQAGLMYGLNRGALYRRILKSLPDPEARLGEEMANGARYSDAEFESKLAQYGKEAVDFEQKARTYATVGAGVSAAVGTGLSSVISLAAKGAAGKVQTLSNEIVARAFTDPALRDIVDRLATAGGHTLAGALYMAVPAVIDDATVQKAVRGEIDYGKAVEAGIDAFKRSLLAAGALAALPHVVPIARDIGRARQAPLDAARLDHLVATAGESKLAQRAPGEFQALVKEQAAGGDASTVYVSPEAAAQPEAAQKLVEALADEGRALAQAQATQTDVAVPIEKYLTSGLHETLRENVKTDPNGSTLKEAHDFLNGPVAKLLAERTVAEAMPEGPERDTNLAQIHQQMRQAVAEQYNFTPADTAALANGATVKLLSEGINGTASEPAPPADAIAWARRLTEEGTIGDLNPGRYEFAAERASDKLAKIATQAAEKGQEAARQGFIGAALQKVGLGPKAGKENLAEAGRKADKAARQLADVPALEQARDLARAQAKVHNEVQGEMESARKYLAKRDTPEFRNELAKASPEYLDAFNAVQDAIDENTPRAPANPQALDALLLRMDADAEPVGDWADTARGILERPGGWKALSPSEGRAVLDMAKNIRAAARRQNELELADRKFTLRERVAEARARLDELKVPGGEPPAPSRASQGLFEKSAETAGEMATEGLQPREILRRLGMMDVYHAFVTARNAKEDLARKVGEDVWRMYERDMPSGLKKTRTDLVQGPGSAVLNDAKWTRQDMWEFASWWGSKSGSDRIKRGLRITDGQAHEFLSQLTNAEVDFINAKSKLNDEVLWPLIRDHQVAVTGTAPPKIEAQPFTIRTADGDIREVRGGYEPARYRQDQNSTATAPENAQTIADYWGNLRDDFPTTARYFLKERVQNTQRVPDLNWSTYSSHVGSVLHYLAYDDVIRNVGRIFRDQEFRELVQRRPALGPQAMKELDKFLSVAARGQVDAAKGGAQRWNQIVGGSTRVLGTALFKSNPVIAFGDLAHTLGGAITLKLGPRDMLYGLSQAMQPNTWGASFDGSEQLPYRWNGYGMKLREQLSNIGPDEQPAGLRWRKWTDAAGWLPYHVADGFVSKVFFEAAASKAERNGASPKEARLAGDDAVAAVMPPLNPAERSSVARDRGLIGSLLLVRGFPNQLFNMAAMMKWDAQNRIWQSDPGWNRAKTALGVGTVAAASFLGVMWSEQLLGNFLMGHGKEQDESWAQWWERQMFSAPFYPIPIVGDVADVVAGAAVSRKPFKQELLYGHRSIRTAPALGLIGDAIKELGDVVDGRTSTDRVFGALKLASTVLGTGTYPLRPLRYSTDLMTDRTHPRGPFDVAGGFFYGKRPRQAKNPATLIQDVLSGD